MATVSGQISVSASFAQTLTNVPSGANAQAPSVSIPISASFNPASGVGADQIDLKYTKTLAFTASTPQVLDLKALTDVEGNAVNFVRVKSIIIILRGLVDAVTLKLGYATTTTNAWVSLISNPGQVTLQAYPTTKNNAAFCLFAPGATGWAVGASNKLLNLDPGSAAFSVDIEITGCSV